MKHPQLKKQVCSELGRAFCAELKQATAQDSNSLIKKTDMDTISTFNWETLQDDLKQHCRQLLQFLHLFVPHNKRKRVGGVMSLIVAMLARLTNQRARLVQTVVSLILLAGHATKQVSLIYYYNEINTHAHIHN